MCVCVCVCVCAMSYVRASSTSHGFVGLSCIALALHSQLSWQVAWLIGFFADVITISLKSNSSN